MSEIDREEMRFGDQDEPDLIEYRPVSRLAILALALGLLSSLSLLAPLMLAASAVAVVVAILAMQQVKRNRAAMIGRGAAVAGLLLALTFASWTVTRGFARQWIVYGQARQFADHWVSLANDGKFLEAHQLALPTFYRQPKGTDLASYYERDEKANEEFEKLFGSEMGAHVKTYAPKYPFKFVKWIRQDRFEDHTYIVQLYAAEIEENGRRRLLPVKVVLQRSNRPTQGQIHWLMYGLGDPNKEEKKQGRSKLDPHLKKREP